MSTVYPDALTVGIDIGGTNMRAAVVAGDGTIIDSHEMPTAATAEALEDGIVQLVRRHQAKYNIAAVGLAVAGFLDPACEVVRFAPHLPWRDRPVRKDLEQLIGLPVRLEHDANSAAWGEYRFGGAQDAETWVLFAIGTGIGATLMHQGEIYRGTFGTAPEFGHLTVVPDGRKCACGKRGCLERYCSGTALEQTAIELLRADPSCRSSLCCLAPGQKLSGKVVMQHARAGDPLALEVFENFATWLGRALSMVVDVLDPGHILIGGGLSGAADLYLDRALTVMSEGIVGAGYRPLPEVRCATLGAEAGMIGVADLARRDLC